MTDLLAIVTDNLVPFLVILTVLVFVHEYGHYAVARRAGVRVEVFSIGFGPELFGWTARSGTRWKFSAIPLGGYVRMFGDSDPSSSAGEGLGEMSEEEREVSFHHKSLGARTAIVAAGPAANFLFAILVLAVLHASVGQRQLAPTVSEVMSGSAAEAGGLAAGDRVVEVDGAPIGQFGDLQQVVSASAGRPLVLVVERDGERVTLTVTPRRVESTDSAGATVSRGQLGVRGGTVEYRRSDPLSAVWIATAETWSLTVQTLAAVREIITGSRSAEELGGPLRIAQISGSAAEAGLATALWFTALLSINLGLINLFPIPVLDGGHLVFYLAEAVRGRPVGERVREYASIAGLTTVIGLMVFVTWNDIVQLRVVDFFHSLFS